MNYLQQLIEEVRIVLFITLLFNNILLFGVWYVTKEIYNLSLGLVVCGLMFSALICNFLLERLVTSIITQPLQLLWRNILHTTPEQDGASLMPRFTNAWLGKDLVSVLTGQVNQLANAATTLQQANTQSLGDLHQDFIINSLPLPLIVLDGNETVLFANRAALKYFAVAENSFVNFNLNSKVTMVFSQGVRDLSAWLQATRQSSVTATQTWEDVKIQPADAQTPRQFDLAAFYNKDNPQKWETVLVFFDHSEKYEAVDQGIDFIALAVHELRTPITMLRGYIEVLDELLAQKLSGETEEYFTKMKIASEQLATFTNNIFNVAHVEGNQMEIHVQEENWPEFLRTITNDLSERATVRGMKLECGIEGELPTVGIDKVSISQVMTNLVDNAIKYSSGKGNTIWVSAKLQDGMVETTVKDSGVGIPESVIPTLFNRYHRNFHNRSVVNGTGLGLYLSKLIVNLHGGNIWVSSKEGTGTTVGFTLLPYAKMSSELKSESSGIIRGSHGWIKNHHMSRR